MKGVDLEDDIQLAAGSSNYSVYYFCLAFIILAEFFDITGDAIPPVYSAIT
jgi:hypothetical protein